MEAAPLAATVGATARPSILLVATLLVLSCGPDANGFVDRATLSKEPAAQLRLPRASELAHVGRERTTTFEGPRSGFDGYILGTDADQETVYAYYARELERLGWTRETTGSASTDEITAWWWCKPRMNYRLAIKDQKKAFRPEFYQGQTFRTVFDATLIGREPGIPCPYVPSPIPSSR